MDLSVIICAHNPRLDYLRRVLKALRDQTIPTHHWELLIIDNASNTPLKEILDLSWHSGARCILEKQVGLSAARERGIKESSATLLVFIDDDNVLDSDYLKETISIGQKWPLLGAWGSGSIVPEFEVQPADYLTEFLSYLALRNTETVRWGNLPFTEATPWGAGLCVRRTVAEAYIKFCNLCSIQISGRRGEHLLGGEDVEIALVACETGFGIGVFPELKITHLIPKERVSEDYFVKIHEGYQLSNCLLEYKWRGVTPRNPFAPWAVLSLVKHVMKNRRVKRRMYLGGVRAALRARRMIAASEGQTGAWVELRIAKPAADC
jgi:glycosyltransferase involved in cell wall biosynthesis